jgi:CheY-like chemotaxis protein
MDGPVILIVEDEESIFQVLAPLLRSVGYHVVHAPNSLCALVWLAAHQPALVLLDLWIPVDGGRRLATAIRQQYGSAVPILLLTAAYVAAEAVNAFGAVGYLRKPFDLDDLLAAVERIVPIDYGADPTAA